MRKMSAQAEAVAMHYRRISNIPLKDKLSLPNSLEPNMNPFSPERDNPTDADKNSASVQQ